MDARDGRRLQSAPPCLRRAKPRRPPQPPRPVRCQSDLVCLSDTGVSPEKCLVYPADALASPQNSRLCESLHRNELFIHRTCKSLHRIASNKLRVFLSHHSSESNKRSVFNSTHRIGSNIRCEYKPLYIIDRLIQRISDPIRTLDSDIR